MVDSVWQVVDFSQVGARIKAQESSCNRVCAPSSDGSCSLCMRKAKRQEFINDCFCKLSQEIERLESVRDEILTLLGASSRTAQAIKAMISSHEEALKGIMQEQAAIGNESKKGA